MFKPLLSPNNSPQDTPDYFQKLQYPLLCSPKLDGIRGCPRDGIVLSRTLKPLPSTQVQAEIGRYSFLDLEIIEGNVTDFDVYNRTQSHVMSRDKQGDMTYHVFDWTEDVFSDAYFYERLELAAREVDFINSPYVKIVEHTLVDDYEELIDYEDANLALGYEGIMLRNPLGRYKTNARCTFRDNIIYKLKRFADDEALIVGIIEQETNNNPLLSDERGYAKRSTCKENMVGAKTLGKLICVYNGVEISVAPGCLTHAQRQKIWDEWDTPQTIRYHFVKFRHFPKGQKDLPRHPRCIGIRDLIDMV